MSESALLNVLSGRAPKRRPIWFMRQAGRYLPEYRAVRSKAGSFLALCYNPELAADVTLQPLRRFDIDAAILFADILVVPHAMGLGLRFAEGEGPILETVASLKQVRALKEVSGTSEVLAVASTVKAVAEAKAKHVGLIGFCGGPWTVASYMIEGGSSDRRKSRIIAYERTDWFEALIERLVVESVAYLGAQIRAGAEAVQIFDSWAGDLCGSARERYVFEPLSRICTSLRQEFPEVPVIVFARGIGADHAIVASRAGCAAIGVESEASLTEIAGILPADVAVQGNLDPLALLASVDALRREVGLVAQSVPMARHVFNLGHGIRPETDLKQLEIVVEQVRLVDG